MNSSRIIPTLILISMFSISGLLAQPIDEPRLQQSVKKQLFVFPVEFERKTGDVNRAQRRYFENELMKELVYNFPRFAFYQMPLDANVDEFLENSNDYLLENAQEIRQKRVDTGGRYGEEPITLDDLKEIVENGYAFVPRMTKGVLNDDSWELDAEIDIYRTHDNHFVGTVYGSTESLGGLMSMSVIDIVNSIDKDDDDKPDKNELAEQYRQRASGVVSELRTKVRKSDEFSIKAIVTNPGINWFTFNQGEELGVELDKRYKVWSTSDPMAEGRVLLAYGKVRKIHENESEVQVLIGGWDLTYADQVVEDARFGINIAPAFGFLPISSTGFSEFEDGTADIPGLMDSGDAELPDDGAESKFWIGVAMEGNVASFTQLSELYLSGETGIVGGLTNTFTGYVSAGITKKYWFRRAAWTASARYGALIINFTNLDNETIQGDEIDNAVVHGLMLTTGLELLLNPDWAIVGEVGYSFMPEQTVLLEDRDDGHAARVGMNGFTIKFGVMFSL
jgi:hypothetical protein